MVEVDKNSEVVEVSEVMIGVEEEEATRIEVAVGATVVIVVAMEVIVVVMEAIAVVMGVTEVATVIY